MTEMYDEQMDMILDLEKSFYIYYELHKQIPYNTFNNKSDYDLNTTELTICLAGNNYVKQEIIISLMNHIRTFPNLTELILTIGENNKMYWSSLKVLIQSIYSSVQLKTLTLQFGSESITQDELYIDQEEINQLKNSFSQKMPQLESFSFQIMNSLFNDQHFKIILQLLSNQKCLKKLKLDLHDTHISQIEQSGLIELISSNVELVDISFSVVNNLRNIGDISALWWELLNLKNIQNIFFQLNNCKTSKLNPIHKTLNAESLKQLSFDVINVQLKEKDIASSISNHEVQSFNSQKITSLLCCLENLQSLVEVSLQIEKYNRYLLSVQELNHIAYQLSSLVNLKKLCLIFGDFNQVSAINIQDFLLKIQLLQESSSVLISYSDEVSSIKSNISSEKLLEIYFYHLINQGKQICLGIQSSINYLVSLEEIVYDLQLHQTYFDIMEDNRLKVKKLEINFNCTKQNKILAAQIIKHIRRIKELKTLKLTTTNLVCWQREENPTEDFQYQLQQVSNVVDLEYDFCSGFKFSSNMMIDQIISAMKYSCYQIKISFSPNDDENKKISIDSLLRLMLCLSKTSNLKLTFCSLNSGKDYIEIQANNFQVNINFQQFDPKIYYFIEGIFQGVILFQNLQLLQFVIKSQCYELDLIAQAKHSQNKCIDTLEVLEYGEILKYQSLFTMDLIKNIKEADLLIVKNIMETDNSLIEFSNQFKYSQSIKQLMIQLDLPIQQIKQILINLKDLESLDIKCKELNKELFEYILSCKTLKSIAIFTSKIAADELKPIKKQFSQSKINYVNIKSSSILVSIYKLGQYSWLKRILPRLVYFNIQKDYFRKSNQFRR